MNQLFDHTTLRGMRLANRFVRSATWEGLADNHGAVTGELTDMMVALAQGEVGLIITGYTFVSPEGKSNQGQMAIYDDGFLPGLTEMTRAVHGKGGKIALQLVHGGCFSDRELTGLEIIGASENSLEGQPHCRAARHEDLHRITADFARGASRARQAGFDAVQIHAAHGFLLSEFLSPFFNRRKDAYGGSLENRTCFLLEVVAAVRQAVGEDFPVLVKLNSQDYLDGGMTVQEAVRVSSMLEQASVDAIEFSGGTISSPVQYIPPRPGSVQAPDQEVYYREAATLFKQHLSIPLILVGGIRSYTVAEELIANKTADYISLARPFISEPALVKRWKEGDRRKAACVSCNGCFGSGLEGRGISCVVMTAKKAGQQAV